MEARALLEHWCDLLKRTGATGDPQETFAQIAKAYQAEGRHYHTLEHIAHCLDVLRKVRILAMQPNAVELALWFHDYVYVIGAEPGKNEMGSAYEAARFCTEHGLSDIASVVGNMVDATAHSRAVLRELTEDEQLVADIDLSSLGAPWEDFLKQSKQVRKERPDLSEEKFARGEKKFLQGLLDRTNIYRTKYFINNYEVSARKNIGCYIATLNAAPS